MAGPPSPFAVTFFMLLIASAVVVLSFPIGFRRGAQKGYQDAIDAAREKIREAIESAADEK